MADGGESSCGLDVLDVLQLCMHQDMVKVKQYVMTTSQGVFHDVSRCTMPSL